jgi:hypothetical protein
MVYDLKDKNKQKYEFLDFKLSKGDQVRTLDKLALFEKGTYKYSDKVYTIATKEGKKFRLEGLKKLYMGYELLLVKDVDNSPGYDQILNDANVEDEMKEAEQDRVERAITKDLGTTKERSPSTRSRLREISDAPSEGEYEIDKILKRRQQPNGRYEYRVQWKGYSDSSWVPRSDFSDPKLYMDFDNTLK